MGNEASDDGRYLWCGTCDGCLFELDIWNGGKLTDFRAGAHGGHVTGIFRLPGHRMITMDEHGKCLVFSGVDMRRGSDENVGASNAGGWLRGAKPRIHRILHRDGFMHVLSGSL